MSQPTYLIIDTETSGLWPNYHGLIEFACAVVNKDLEIIDTFTIDIKPPKKTVIDKTSLKINGFTQERIEAGASYQVATEKITDFISKHFITTTPILVGQFYPFDYAFLTVMYTSVNKIQELESFLSNKFIDTKSTVILANKRAEFQNKKLPFPSTSLSSPGGLKDVLEIKEQAAHTALGDVLMTHEVFVKLIKYKEI
jgi:DNA polymerase III alpha subunit (gram-positive type)